MKIYDDKIEFSNYSIHNHPEGIRIDGRFKANGFESYRSPVTGTVDAYVSGGFNVPTNVNSTSMDKFPFANESADELVGNLSVSRNSSTGHSSDVAGYVVAGNSASTPSSNSTITEKFLFGSESTITDVGDFPNQSFSGATGNSSVQNGYVTFGSTSPPVITSNQRKFPFANDAAISFTTSISEYGGAYPSAAGQSSSVDGYVSGGFPSSNTIYKFPFSSEVDSLISHSTLTQSRYEQSGQSSSTHGYNSGGRLYPNGNPSVLYAYNNYNTIDKFSFASTSSSTDVGDLSPTNRHGSTGNSSVENGYASTGGISPPSLPASQSMSSSVYKFSFASDTNAGFVTSLSQSRTSASGQEN